MKAPYNKLENVLGKIATRHSFHQVFDDFMEIAICALSFGKMEPKYHEIIKRYDNDEVAQYSEAFANMILEYESKSDNAGAWFDALGNIFETTGSISAAQRMGQFFTPPTVCDLMAKMTNTGPANYDTSVCDPACGSGRNLISHSRLHITNRTNYMYYGMDLDRRCVNMTVLNMVMYGMRGYVIHMDTLRLECYGGYRIYLPETGMGITPLTADQCKQLVVSSNLKEVVNEKSNNNGGQLTMF